MNNEEVIARYANRQVNTKTRDVHFSGHNVSCEGNLLFSHGTVICMYLGEKSGRHFFIKNMDKYSDSTSGHQNTADSYCFGPCVSRRALGKAGIDMTSLAVDDVIFARPEFVQGCYRDHNGKYWLEMDLDSFPHENPQVEFGKHDEEESKPKHVFRSIDAPYDPPIPVFSGPWTPPKYGEFIKTGENNGWYNSGVWRIVSACVIKAHGEYWLCAKHDQARFCARLGKRPTSIENALKLVKSPGATVNQGPWSFVPTDLSTEDVAKECEVHPSRLRAMKVHPLPGGDHQCRYIWASVRGTATPFYCTGRVYHRRGMVRSPGMFKVVDLGDKWWTAHRHSPYYTE